MLASLRGYWADARPAQRLAYLTGAALLGVGLAYGLIWLAVGGSAEGPLSWRKPTTFGVSFGLTLIALAWVAQFLALSDRALRATMGILVVSFSVAVAWVGVQHARGVASHFNESTPLDFGLFLATGAAVVLGVGVIAWYAWRSFTSSTAPPAMALALRAGLLILLVSMGAGLWMILRGTAFDLEPATVGAGGSITLLHAVGMHAIEVLPALAWVASFGSLAGPARRTVVAVATLGYLLLVGLTAVLAMSGTELGGAGPIGRTVEVAAAICLAVAWMVALAGLRGGHRAQVGETNPTGGALAWEHVFHDD